MSRDAYLKRKYGITEKQYNTMLRKQGRCCALCGKHERLFMKSLAVDHNHRTGRIRAILCFYCNKYRIGRNSLEWAKKVYEYFSKYDPEGG